MRNKALNNRIWIKGLIVQCPLGTPASDCPLNGMRSLPIKEANDRVNELPDDTVKAFILTHRECYHHRRKEMKHPVL